MDPATRGWDAQQRTTFMDESMRQIEQNRRERARVKGDELLHQEREMLATDAEVRGAVTAEEQEHQERVLQPILARGMPVTLQDDGYFYAKSARTGGFKRIFEMNPEVDYGGLPQGATAEVHHDEFVEQLLTASDSVAKGFTHVTEISSQDQDTPGQGGAHGVHHPQFTSTRVHDPDEDVNERDSLASFTPSQREKLQWIEEQTRLAGEMILQQQQLLTNRIREEEQEKEERLLRKKRYEEREEQDLLLRDKRKEEEDRCAAAQRQAGQDRIDRELQGVADRARQLKDTQSQLEAEGAKLQQRQKEFLASEQKKGKEWQEKERLQSAIWTKTRRELEEARAQADRDRQDAGADVDRKQAWIATEVDRLTKLQSQQRQTELELQKRQEARERADKEAAERQRRMEEQLQRRQKALEAAERAVAEQQNRAAQQADRQRLQDRMESATQSSPGGRPKTKPPPIKPIRAEPQYSGEEDFLEWYSRALT
jgi:hypothetical protein